MSGTITHPASRGPTIDAQRASASRPSGERNDDDYDVLADGVVERIMKAAAAPVGQPWLCTLTFGHHEDPTPTHGYEATREAAIAAFVAARVMPLDRSRRARPHYRK
jgi:hypothetical protein